MINENENDNPEMQCLVVQDFFVWFYFFIHFSRYYEAQHSHLIIIYHTFAPKTHTHVLYTHMPLAGGKTPTIDSPCECHYAGTLIDGTEFDSSYARGEPTTFAPNEVIGGWTEALQLMTEGAKWELYIPSELGYGSRGSGGDIPGGAALVFTLELLKVRK